MINRMEHQYLDLILMARAILMARPFYQNNITQKHHVFQSYILSMSIFRRNIHFELQQFTLVTIFFFLASQNG